jgi:hypothetical protein
MSMRAGRPGVVTFIGVILYIQAFLAAISAVVVFAFRNDITDFLEKQGAPVSNTSLTGSAIGQAVAAVLLFIVASGLMRGSRGIRVLVAIVEAITMGIALWIMLFHHTGAYLYQGIFTLLVGVFVLWALYGNERSDAFFGSS